jgi:hypothetical protein
MIKQFLLLLNPSDKSHLTEKQGASLLLFLRFMRLPTLCALFLISAEFVRVAVAHYQGIGGRVVVVAKRDDGGREDLDERADDSAAEDNLTTDERSTESGSEKNESTDSANNADDEPVAQTESLVGTGAEHETNQEASVEDGQEASDEDGELDALAAAQLEEAAAERERLGGELGGTLVNLITGVATAQGSTRYAIEKVAQDIRAIIEQLTHFPLDKLRAPTQTVDERTAPEAEINTQTVDRSGEQEVLTSSPRRRPEPSITQVSTKAKLVLVNASDSAGSVRFLVNDVLYELLPGETEQMGSGQSWRVQFHRGGGFGDADYTLTDGRYEFRVTEFGWRLTGAGRGVEKEAK